MQQTIPSLREGHKNEIFFKFFSAKKIKSVRPATLIHHNSNNDPPSVNQIFSQRITKLQRRQGKERVICRHITSGIDKPQDISYQLVLLGMESNQCLNATPRFC